MILTGKNSISAIFLEEFSDQLILLRQGVHYNGYHYPFFYYHIMTPINSKNYLRGLRGLTGLTGFAFLTPLVFNFKISSRSFTFILEGVFLSFKNFSSKMA